MRFGLCASLENLAFVGGIGFDYIELSATAVSALPDTEFDLLSKKLDALDLRAECFNLLFPKSMRLLGDESQPEMLEPYLEHTFFRLKQLGGVLAVFGSGKCRNLPEAISFENGFKQLVSITQITGSIAAKYGIKIAIEPLNRRESNMISSVTEAAMLSYCAAEQNVGILADSFHMTEEHEPFEHISMVKKIFHTHIAAPDTRGYPLTEEPRIRDFFAVLGKVGYDKRMSIEGKSDNLEKDGAAALQFLKSFTSKGKDND